MKAAIWHNLVARASELKVGKQHVTALLAVAGLAAITMSLITGNMVLFALCVLSPAIIVLSVSMFTSPMVMFFSIFVVNYFIIAIMRYTSIDGLSVFIDVMLWLQLLSLALHKWFYGGSWRRAANLLTALSLLWMLYCFLELFNPSAVFEAWLMSRRLIYQGLVMAVVASLLFENFKQVRWLIILYSILTLLAVAKALGQYLFGFDPYEMQWLMESGSAKTHLIYGGRLIRYYSFFTDAGNFGSNMGCSGIIFLILTLYEKSWPVKIYYAIVGLLSIYAMFLSGTRGAMIVPMAGLALYIILSKNFKLMTIFGVILAAMYIFFAHTWIGEGNPLISRMRTAFNPSKDASFQVRMENQAILRGYMRNKPFGEGVGLGGVEARQYAHRVTTEIPHDSWYVKIWMETGIVGLILYVGILVAVLIKCCHVIMFRITDVALRGYLTAMVCGSFGMMVSAYGNAFLGQLPTMLTMFTFLAVAINGQRISSADNLLNTTTDGK